jgi:DNA-3-methyladenine glycosylase II
MKCLKSRIIKATAGNLPIFHRIQHIGRGASKVQPSAEKTLGTVREKWGSAVNAVMRSTQAEDESRFTLKVVPPFRLDLTVWALRRRPENKMDRWDGKTFCRGLVLNGKPVEIAVIQIGSMAAPRLQITVTGVPFGHDVVAGVTRNIEPDVGPPSRSHGLLSVCCKGCQMSVLAQRFRGVKPPQFPSLLEALVNGIACQQFSLASGIQMLNRVSEKFGTPS